MSKFDAFFTGSVRMTSSAATADIPADVLDQAIALSVRLRSGTLNASETERLNIQLMTWRQAAPVHEVAWQELLMLDRELLGVHMPAKQAFDTLEIVQNIRHARKGRRKILQILGVGAVSVGVGVFTAGQQPVRQWGQHMGADYATGVGEQRTITLADGTQLHLNTNTAIDVHYDASQRMIRLLHGEIFVQTGKDTASDSRRPFYVQTATARLEAIGTQFFVRQESMHTRLYVTEGRVAIRNAADMIVHAGQSYDITDAGLPVQVVQTDYDMAGWIDGALVVKQMRLGDLVFELGRYRQGWLRCDPQIADLRVSGVFQVHDTDKALIALVQTLPIKVMKRTRYWVSLYPK